MLVCLAGVLRPTRGFFTHWRYHHYQWRTSNLTTCPLHSWPLSSAGSLAYVANHNFFDILYTSVYDPSPCIEKWHFELHLYRWNYAYMYIILHFTWYSVTSFFAWCYCLRISLLKFTMPKNSIARNTFNILHKIHQSEAPLLGIEPNFNASLRSAGAI